MCKQIIFIVHILFMLIIDIIFMKYNRVYEIFQPERRPKLKLERMAIYFCINFGILMSAMFLTSLSTYIIHVQTVNPRIYTFIISYILLLFAILFISYARINRINRRRLVLPN